MTWYVLDAAGEVCGPVGAHEWALFAAVRDGRDLDDLGGES